MTLKVLRLKMHRRPRPPRKSVTVLEAIPKPGCGGICPYESRAHVSHQRVLGPILGWLCVCLVVWTHSAKVEACPFCPPTGLTFAEQLENAPTVVLAQWATATKPTEGQSGQTIFEVVDVLKTSNKTVVKGNRITIGGYWESRSGDLFMLFASGKDEAAWDDPVEMTETAAHYISQAPPIESPVENRLTYFLKFLEFSDPLIADDAFAEFSKARYKDVLPLAKHLPRKKIRGWVFSEETPPTRIGFYGLLLGLCGNEQDAVDMEQHIVAKTDGPRFGIEGVMAGYLLLRGEAGLELLNRTTLHNTDASEGERYRALQAVRFMWTYAAGKINKAALKESLRGLIERPDVAELAIIDLARWKDWSIQSRLVELYDSKTVYADPSRRAGINKAIIRYMVVSTRYKRDETSEEPPPEHVTKGKRYVALLREKDPDTFEKATKFFPY